MPVNPRTFDISIEPIQGPQDSTLLSSAASVSSRRNALSARHWHNRYMAWQVRERRQREEAEKLEKEKRRIFGEASDGGEEDERLCVKMMEYFGGLDFIEP